MLVVLLSKEESLESSADFSSPDLINSCTLLYFFLIKRRLKGASGFLIISTTLSSVGLEPLVLETSPDTDTIVYHGAFLSSVPTVTIFLADSFETTPKRASLIVLLAIIIRLNFSFLELLMEP